MHELSIPRAGDESEWVSVHAFHQGDLTDLLLTAVEPLMTALTAEGTATAWFFLRYWDGGPHLRLRVLPTSPAHRDQVLARVTGELERHLQDHPSSRWLEQREYAHLAPLLAAREHMASYERLMYPNDSVVALPYRREHGRYGYSVSIEAVERHFAESSRLVTGLLRAGCRRPALRDTFAFCLLLVTWSVARSPWSGRRPTPDDLPDTAELEACYLGQRDRLTRLAAGVRAYGVRGNRERGPANGALGFWARSLDELRSMLTGAGNAGTAIPAVLDLCAHLACNRLGVMPNEEWRIRYLAARTAAESLGDGAR
ncbi:thiopeptide-type bacteriocin biosynthesis protein [Actinomadura verrucosospora]